MPKFDPGPPETDDLSCTVCGAPLLSKKSTCPKCGTKWGQHPTPLEGTPEPEERIPGAHFMASARPAPARPDRPKEPLLPTVMVFMSGIAILYALMNPIIDSFSMDALWHSLSMLMMALIVLGLRSLMLRS